MRVLEYFVVQKWIQVVFPIFLCRSLLVRFVPVIVFISALTITQGWSRVHGQLQSTFYKENEFISLCRDLRVSLYNGASLQAIEFCTQVMSFCSFLTMRIWRRTFLFPMWRTFAHPSYSEQPKYIYNWYLCKFYRTCYMVTFWCAPGRQRKAALSLAGFGMLLCFCICVNPYLF